MRNMGMITFVGLIKSVKASANGIVFKNFAQLVKLLLTISLNMELKINL